MNRPGFSCRDQFLAMAFAQLTYRESLRDIEACYTHNAGPQSKSSYGHERILPSIAAFPDLNSTATRTPRHPA